MKRPLILFLFVLCSNCLWSQNCIGFKSGLTFANTRFHNQWDFGFEPGRYYYTENLIRPFASAYIEFKLNSTLLFQTELAYLSMGSSNKLYYGSEIPFNYTALPVSFKYCPDKIGISVGAYAGYVFKNSDFGSTKPWDLGVHTGVEYLFVERAGIGIRYFYGLLNLYKGSTEPLYNPFDEIYNRGLQFYLFFPVLPSEK